MVDIIKDLKHKARHLHRNILTSTPQSLAFIRKQPGLVKLSNAELIEQTLRRHCLSQLAIFLGFQGWAHLLKVMQEPGSPPGENQRSVVDYGKLLYPPRCGVYTNIWHVFYGEARQVRQKNAGYLLPYKTQFLVCEADYIRTLGLDPEDQNWNLLERDWINPAAHPARNHLYKTLIDHALAGQGWLYPDQRQNGI
ncbi:hypothetical protein [Kiloniella laminariae]|uniref:hypothetical protein n=1 Tax=Kiloniella laminariae TaxID=454162 RepID=UPI00035F6267|nr:hypothetical protein [Kiloniella laminariae]